MRTILLKHYKGSNRKITAQAYRNGTGGVALTMSGSPEASLNNNGEDFDGIDETFFNALGIMVVTPRQGDQSWFIARMFSITSTAAYSHIKFNLTARAAGKYGGLLTHWEMLRRYITSS